MSRQDKATTDRNARTLRDLVKQPDNKNCADCRKNDARWASWNLGVFLCIRCSGIHRSMGTHISKVKSIDLDMWTPEQMVSVQKWGNKRANLYWERHLKAGHVPPEHKIESFIRSKYESKRWAMDGPPPSDPSVLEDAAGRLHAPPVDTSTKPTPTSSAPAPTPSKTHPLLSRQTAPKPAPTPAPVVDLIGDDDPTPPPATAPAATNGAGPSAPTAEPVAQGSSIFDLDFRAPATAKPSQSNKADIMSLFSSTSPTTQPQQSFFSAPAAPPAQNPYASWGGGGTSTTTTLQNPTQAPLPNANAEWGMQMDTGAWGAPQSAPPQQNPSQPNTQMWNQPAQSQNPWGGGDPWATAAPAVSPPTKKQENDPFANLWK